jgi:hypothetical protein
MGGFQQQRESGLEARQLEQQGQIAATNASGEIIANDVAARQALAQGTANAAASGVSANSGSVRAVRSMNESMAILRDTYARYKGQVAENNAYYQARAARYQGGQAAAGGLVSGVTTALTSGANAYAMKKYGAAGTSGKDSFWSGWGWSS